jgi:putative mRNA 3-end processing factor
MLTKLLSVTPEGLYCPQGQFHIDPWRPVRRAVITHAHSDHARWGCDEYLSSLAGKHVFHARLGENANLTTLEYGEVVEHHGVKVSLHPAGHLLGSAQVRLEYAGEVVVVSGDYKLAPDPTCASFEPVRCHTYVTESTFGLPIYTWEEPAAIFESMNTWWRQNRDAGKVSIVYAYALGKAQRILASVDASIGTLVMHGAVEKLNRAYRASGVALPDTVMVSDDKKRDWAGALVIAPPSAQSTPWVKRFEPYSEGVASGWMAVRGVRRRRGVDRGFILSDHADWPGLNRAIRETGCENVLVTHGSTEIFARHLREQGLQAEVLQTLYSGDADDATEAA